MSGEKVYCKDCKYHDYLSFCNIKITHCVTGEVIDSTKIALEHLLKRNDLKCAESVGVTTKDVLELHIASGLVKKGE